MGKGKLMDVDSMRVMTIRVGMWREREFGAVRGNALERRISYEMKELHDELFATKTDDPALPPQDARDPQKIAKEAADVIITVMAWFYHQRFDLSGWLDNVQTQNEQRTWESYGDGTGRHVGRG